MSDERSPACRWVTALAGAALVGVACGPSVPSGAAPSRGEGVPTATSASAVPSASVAPPSASAEPAAEPAPSAPTGCAPVEAAPGYQDCELAELTGAAPCEAICRRARRATPSRCCQDPVEVVVLSGARTLLRLNACSFVPPECAHVHGHGNMDAHLRVLAGPPPEVVFVEGGCEARAMLHGYVPPGVAAWSGCKHQRYRWDGGSLAKVPKAGGTP